MNNNKIAVLTQAPLGTNYGNTVQAYALQEVLKKNNFEVTVLNRVKAEIYNAVHWNLSQFKNELLNVIDKKNRITPRVFEEIFKGHMQFVHENINYSKYLYNTEELKNYILENRYTALIVGSDQTWRPSYSPNIYNYFLDFLVNNKSIKKIAYASSFGTDQWEFSMEETKKCCQLAQQFDAISVREKSGIELCENYLNVQASWVLDPTFLLTKEEYINVANKKQIPKRSGLFSYILDENDAIENIIHIACSQLQLNHFTNQPVWRRNNKEGIKIKDLKYPSVEGWLKAFEDADFIVTNSFHGTVFAIIFNKPFLTIINNQRGGARFYSLLQELGLENRLIEENEVDKIGNIIATPINYDVVNKRLEVLKKYSIEFLLSILKR